MKNKDRPFAWVCFAWLCMALALLAVVMYLRACERAQRVEVRK